MIIIISQEENFFLLQLHTCIKFTAHLGQLKVWAKLSPEFIKSAGHLRQQEMCTTEVLEISGMS